MTAWRRPQGSPVQAQRGRRVWRQMGLEAIDPGPRLSQRAEGHEMPPDLVRGVTIARVKQVWSTDIPSLRVHAGGVSLVAGMDWFSRSVLAWEVSGSVDRSVCVSALERALIRGQPELFNSAHGAPFTSRAFLERLQRGGMRLSLDGRGRALDNVFVERRGRSMKDEEVYSKDYRSGQDASNGLRSDVDFYNRARWQQSVHDQTPAAVYRQGERQTAIATFT